MEEIFRQYAAKKDHDMCAPVRRRRRRARLGWGESAPSLPVRHDDARVAKESASGRRGGGRGGRGGPAPSLRPPDLTSARSPASARARARARARGRARRRCQYAFKMKGGGAVDPGATVESLTDEAAALAGAGAPPPPGDDSEDLCNVGCLGCAGPSEQ